MARVPHALLGLHVIVPQDMLMILLGFRLGSLVTQLIEG
jgi:hypothetical protein